MLAALIFLASFSTASAETPSCVELYRQAYISYPSRWFPNKAAYEAQEIYKIYFDYRNRLSVVYEEAKIIFAPLQIKDTQHDLVLDLVAGKMERGELCISGKTMRLKKILRVIKQSQGDI